MAEEVAAVAVAVVVTAAAEHTGPSRMNSSPEVLEELRDDQMPKGADSEPKPLSLKSLKQ